MKNSKVQFSVSTTLLLTMAFALGFVSKNLVSGLRPFAMELVLPSATSPVSAGDYLTIESYSDPSFNRRVKVLSDSTIRLPQIGDLDCSGMSLDDIEKAILKKLGKSTKKANFFHIAVFRSEAYEVVESEE